MHESTKKNFPFFDSIFQNSPFQMIKILLPFLPSSSQKTMAIFIKFFELKYTIDFFNRGNRLCSMMDSIDSSNPMEMMSAIKDFFPKDQQENFDNILQMFQAMEMFQAFQGEDSFSNPFEGGNPQDMFQMFSGMFQEKPEKETSKELSKDSPEICSQEICPQAINSQDVLPKESSVPTTSPIPYEL